MICFRCQKENLILDGIVGRGDYCIQCGSSLRVCKNCEHYDAKAYNECHEPNADRVLEKEKSNFCDHFTPSKRVPSVDKKPKLDPRAAAEALFKK